MAKKRGKAEPPKFLLDALDALSAGVTRDAAYGAQIAEVFRRLVYDPRMIGVYGELLKRTRPERRQFHESQPLWSNTDLQYDATEHEKAIIGLLLTAAHFAVDSPLIVPKRALEGGPIPELAELREYEIRHGSAVVLTKAGAQDAALTAFLRKLTTETRAVFGKLLPGVVATIAGVALNRGNITEATVRGAVKNR